MWKKGMMKVNRMMAFFLCFLMLVESLPVVPRQAEARLSGKWEEAATGMTGPVKAAYGNGIYAVLDQDSSIYISENGTDFQKTISFGEDGFDAYEAELTYMGGFFFLYNGDRFFKVSQDGRTWTNGGMTGHDLIDMAYDEGYFYLLTGSYGYN